MAKFTILPILLLLAMALPLLLAVSGSIQITTEVDCGSSRGDVEGGSRDPIDVVEPESEVDEQLDDHQGFFDDEEEAGSMSSDVELESDINDQYDDEGLFQDEAEDEAGSMPSDVELESDIDEQLGDEGSFQDEDEDGSMSSDMELDSDIDDQLDDEEDEDEDGSMSGDDMELESDIDDDQYDDEVLFQDEADLDEDEAGSMPSNVEQESYTDEQLNDEGSSEDENEDGSMSGDDMELESDIDDDQYDDEVLFQDEADLDEDEAGSTPSDMELESDTDEQLGDEGLSQDEEDEDGSMPSYVELGSDIDEQLDDESSFQDEDEASYIAMPTDNREQDDSERSESSYSDDHAAEFDPKESTSSEDNLGVPVRNVVTQAFFDSIIRKAAPNCKGKRFYTRAAFLTATRSYPRFGQLKPDPAAKREIAAFFAHVTHETGSLCYTEEIKKSRYCDPKAKQWPCAPGRQYYGRGPLQLTWNYNYGPCGRANRFDGLKNPDIVARNRVVAWKAALWFWMKNVRPVVGRGFGPTIRAINGALECNGKNPGAVKARVDFYRAYCKRFGVAPGPNLTC